MSQTVKVGDILVNYYTAEPYRVEGFIRDRQEVLLKRLSNHAIVYEQIKDLFRDATRYAHNVTGQPTAYVKLEIKKHDILKHFKGKKYIVLNIATRTTDLGTDVIYMSEGHEDTWSRPLEEMFSYVGGRIDNSTGQLTRFVVEGEL